MVSNDFKQWGGRSYRPRRTDALRATMSGAKVVTHCWPKRAQRSSLWRLASVNPVVAEPVIGPTTSGRTGWLHPAANFRPRGVSRGAQAAAAAARRAGCGRCGP
jgi:hypothetical protein